MRRMFVEGEDCIYYLTVENELYSMPAMPEAAREGILRGMHRLEGASDAKTGRRTTLLASGALVNEALRARTLLEERYGVATDVWSVTSYKQLYRDALAAERWNRLHPGDEPRVPWLTRCLGGGAGAVVAVSDYVQALPYSIAPWVPGRYVALGTEGFGRSDGRPALRDFFEVDARYAVVAALGALAREGVVPSDEARRAIKDLEIDPEKVDPAVS